MHAKMLCLFGFGSAPRVPGTCPLLYLNTAGARIESPWVLGLCTRLKTQKAGPGA
jgi:hypothetical protein